MSLFEKCKENIIDGRRVYVCSRVTGYIEIYNKWIVQICTSRRVAKFFPSLWFSLERSVEEASPGYVIEQEIYQGIVKIHLFPNKLSDFRTFESFIIHELTHLWHEYVGRWAKKKAKSDLLVFRATNKLLLKELGGTGLPTIRKTLNYFIWELYLEGIAKFNGDLTAGIIEFTRPCFLSNYQLSLEYAQKLTKFFLGLSVNPNTEKLPYNFKNEQARKKVIDSLTVANYTIGSHLVFSLLYLDPNLNLTKIAKMNHFTFIKKYEACMEKRGLKPVVSLTSGAGEFDYKRSLQQWWKAVKG